MARRPLLQISHHLPKNPLLIPIKPRMIASDPKHRIPPPTDPRVAKRKLDVGESLVDLVEKVGFDFAGLRVPAALWRWSV
jgi:hypothetical protein